MKWRNSKERELLASGGSREQTLPNKNNPNPDLSDADADKAKMDLSDVAMDDDEEDLHSASSSKDCNVNHSGGYNSTRSWSPDDEEDIEINVT
mgnify:CR=1 FL=1